MKPKLEETRFFQRFYHHSRLRFPSVCVSRFLIALALLLVGIPIVPAALPTNSDAESKMGVGEVPVLSSHGTTVAFSPFSTPSTRPPLSPVIMLDNDGTDWGARINAADARLGDHPGTIEVRGGGRFSTPVILSSYHRLLIGAGTYANRYFGDGGHGALFMPKDHTVIEGAGWNTIIEEAPGSAYGSWTLFAPYTTMRVDGTKMVYDITLSNIQFSGVGIQKGHQSADSTTGGGILNGGVFDHIWLNQTHAIGLSVGNTNWHDIPGNVAQNVTVINCLFTRVGGNRGEDGGGGVSAAIINGDHITFDHNRFQDAQGNAFLDLEPNVPGDSITNINIINNSFVDDWSTGGGENYVYGIAIHVGSPRYGPLTIARNVFRGGYYRDGQAVYYPASYLLTAIYVFGCDYPPSHFIIAKNDIRYTGGSAIGLECVTNSRVSDNHIFMPNNSLSVQVNSHHNIIERNEVATAASQGGYHFGILEMGSSDYNSFLNNRTTGDLHDPSVPVVVVGPHSVSRGNTIIAPPRFP